MNDNLKVKFACEIKFFPGFNEIEDLPQDEVVIVKSKEEILKFLGLTNIDSTYESVFLELRNIKVLDKEK